MVTNWGNYPTAEANVTESAELSEIRKLVAKSEHLIARGNGRCYGDSSLGENIFSTLRLNKFLEFDRENGIIECESGVLLSEILDVIVPSGFFLPVTPGTKFITVGGAVAADVHGKNHHCDGSFANHIVHFDLMTGDGTTLRCSRAENADLFWQTCGGMGLTGVILAVKFKLKPIETAYIDQISYKTADLESTMKLFEQSGSSTYSVAWLDCFASKKDIGRSILMLGEHCNLSDLPKIFNNEPLRKATGSALNVPLFMPSFALNYLSLKAFNTLYYHRQMRSEVRSTVHFEPYFYPLDGMTNWNRLYGKNGFVQYQFVLPLETSYDGLTRILEKVSRSGQGSPLAVLKLFGKADPEAVMSFPMEGYTLALDFKAEPSVFRLLDELDEIVLEDRGRIYLAKDARMKAETFRRSYSKIVSFGHFSSTQSERLEF
ncbi:MAG: FAD-binding oxidoreductase [Acidobacteria bacterium]|nr:FAD-binding oxidoreductase [Acidobacteriota bacterium]